MNSVFEWLWVKIVAKDPKLVVNLQFKVLVGMDSR